MNTTQDRPGMNCSETLTAWFIPTQIIPTPKKYHVNLMRVDSPTSVRIVNRMQAYAYTYLAIYQVTYFEIQIYPTNCCNIERLLVWTDNWLILYLYTYLPSKITKNNLFGGGSPQRKKMWLQKVYENKFVKK
jgi:hypothetical protein